MKRFTTALILAAIVSLGHIHQATADWHLHGWQEDMDYIDSLRHDPNPAIRHCVSEIDDDMDDNKYWISAWSPGKEGGGPFRHAANYHRETYTMPWFVGCVEQAKL